MTFPLKRFTIHGNSMLPTLTPGQDVLVWCWLNKYQAGDVVAVKVNGKDMVKRIQKTDDRRIFVMGDNEKMSTDSRKFGWIDKKDIIGKLIFFMLY